MSIQTLISLNACLLVIGLIALVEAQSAANVTALREFLLDGGYDKNVRPVKDQNEVIDVSFSYNLTSIIDFNDQEESIKLSGYLTLSWTDAFLIWNPADYGGLDHILLPQDEIWRPDAVLQNAFKKFEAFGSSYLKAYITHEGYVSWYPYQIFESTCDVDITYFPFDVQECPITITAWNYEKYKVQLYGIENKIGQFDYTENAMWTLIDSSVEQTNTIVASVIFKIKLKRKPSHFVIDIIIPLLLLSSLAILTFVLPVTSGERASYAVTIFLSMAVFLTIVSSNLPSSSDNVSILSIYLATLCCDTTAIVVVSLFQLRLLTRDESDQPVDGCFKIIYNITMAIRCKIGGRKRKHSFNIENNGVDVKANSISWKEVVNALDYLFFWFFLLCTVAVTTYFFVICTTNQPDQKNLQEISNY